MRAIGWLLVLLLTWPSPVRAEVYRWTAPDGAVHFSDAPPKDKTQVDTIAPRTINSGSLSTPEAREAWREATGPGAATKRPSIPNPYSQSGIPPPSSGQAAAAVSSAGPVVASLQSGDRCAGREATCFSDVENEICWYRFGRACIEMHVWKVCWQQHCDEQRLTDACNSAWDFMVRRPASLMEHRVGESLPDEFQITAEDRACLLDSGFYCHELMDDATCQKRYGLACAELRGWVSRAHAKCLETRTADCDDPAIVARQRPLGVEEVARVRVPSRDLWLQALGALREKDASSEQMSRMLDELPGLDVGQSGGMHECGATSSIK